MFHRRCGCASWVCRTQWACLSPASSIQSRLDAGGVTAPICQRLYQDLPETAPTLIMAPVWIFCSTEARLTHSSTTVVRPHAVSRPVLRRSKFMVLIPGMSGCVVPSPLLPPATLLLLLLLCCLLLVAALHLQMCDARPGGWLRAFWHLWLCPTSWPTQPCQVVAGGITPPEGGGGGGRKVCRLARFLQVG